MIVITISTTIILLQESTFCAAEAYDLDEEHFSLIPQGVCLRWLMPSPT